VPGAGIGRGLVALLALACGVSVANIYYAQPVLHRIAVDLGVGSDAAGLVVTGSQVGYAAGLALLVPVGDVVARRRLVPLVLVLTALALVGMALAPALSVLVAFAAVVGLGSVAAQILVPLAAGLATESERGRVVGVVMSGLLLGILLARTLAGAVAEVAGWRGVFVVAAVLVGLLVLLLARALPADAPRPRVAYGRLLASVAAILAREPLVRRRAVLGGLNMAAFSVFWTTVAFVLSAPPFAYGEAVIGLFGLLGAAGALAAMWAGRLADRGLTAHTTAAFALMIVAAFGMVLLGAHSLAWMVAGVLVLDLGVQGLQVTNQSLIYRGAGTARSRVTSAYMVVYFAGGALGSAGGAAVYARAGWDGTCALGAALGAAALAVWAWDVAAPLPGGDRLSRPRRPGGR